MDFGQLWRRITGFFSGLFSTTATLNTNPSGMPNINIGRPNLGTNPAGGSPSPNAGMLASRTPLVSFAARRKIEVPLGRIEHRMMEDGRMHMFWNDPAVPGQRVDVGDYAPNEAVAIVGVNRNRLSDRPVRVYGRDDVGGQPPLLGQMPLNRAIAESSGPQESHELINVMLTRNNYGARNLRDDQARNSGVMVALGDGVRASVLFPDSSAAGFVCGPGVSDEDAARHGRRIGYDIAAASPQEAYRQRMAEAQQVWQRALNNYAFGVGGPYVQPGVARVQYIAAANLANQQFNAAWSPYVNTAFDAERAHIARHPLRAFFRGF